MQACIWSVFMRRQIKIVEVRLVSPGGKLQTSFNGVCSPIAAQDCQLSGGIFYFVNKLLESHSFILIMC